MPPGRFRFTDVEGRVGNSDIAGAYTVSTGAPTDFTADLHSKRVDLADLGGVIGGTPAAPAPPARPPSSAGRSPGPRPARG